MDSFAISVSHGLQYGVPLKSYVKTLRGTTFAPSGITDDPEIRTAPARSRTTSFRRLALNYLSFDDRLELGLASISMTCPMSRPVCSRKLCQHRPAKLSRIAEQKVQPSPAVSQAPAMPTADAKATVGDQTAPLCYNCGNQTQRAGSCYVCSSCGSTTGCS